MFHIDSAASAKIERLRRDDFGAAVCGSGRSSDSGMSGSGMSGIRLRECGGNGRLDVGSGERRWLWLRLQRKQTVRSVI